VTSVIRATKVFGTRGMKEKETDRKVLNFDLRQSAKAHTVMIRDVVARVIVNFNEGVPPMKNQY